MPCHPIMDDTNIYQGAMSCQPYMGAGNFFFCYEDCWQNFRCSGCFVDNLWNIWFVFLRKSKALNTKTKLFYNVDNNQLLFIYSNKSIKEQLFCRKNWTVYLQCMSLFLLHLLFHKSDKKKVRTYLNSSCGRLYDWFYNTCFITSLVEFLKYQTNNIIPFIYIHIG